MPDYFGKGAPLPAETAQLARDLVAKWKAQVPKDRIVEDDLAKEEKKCFANDLRRNEALKETFHCVFKTALWVVGILFILIVLIRVWHFVGPDKFRWLTDVDIQTLDKVLTSGVLGGILGRQFDKILGPSRRDK